MALLFDDGVERIVLLSRTRGGYPQIYVRSIYSAAAWGEVPTLWEHFKRWLFT